MSDKDKAPPPAASGDMAQASSPRFTMRDVDDRPNEDNMNGGHKVYDFKSVGVFLGSSPGYYPGTKEIDPIYEAEARALGAYLGSNGYRVVYGGGDAGLMGAMSEEVLKNGGKLLGVLTEAFVQADQDYIQRTHPNAEEVVTSGIEVRKWKMITESDAFFVLSGGLGSLDELGDAGVEQYQRPYRGKATVSKPTIVVSTKGIYDHTRAQFEEMINRGFARAVLWGLYDFVPNVDTGIQLFESLQGQPRREFAELGNVHGGTQFSATPGSRPAGR